MSQCIFVCSLFRLLDYGPDEWCLVFSLGGNVQIMLMYKWSVRHGLNSMIDLEELPGLGHERRDPSDQELRAVMVVAMRSCVREPTSLGELAGLGYTQIQTT